LNIKQSEQCNPDVSRPYLIHLPNRRQFQHADPPILAQGKGSIFRPKFRYSVSYHQRSGTLDEGLLKHDSEKGFEIIFLVSLENDWILVT
jgi:hypothetical protein